MKISEGKIRQIIRQEARRVFRESRLGGEVDEMAYMGRLGVAYDDHVKNPPEDEDEMRLSFGAGEEGPNPKGAERYAKSKRFNDLAVKTFRHFPYDVWAVPYIGSGTALGVFDSSDDGRIRIENLRPDGIEILKDLGIDGGERVKDNALVIVYTTMTTRKVSLHSPWIILHSMFHAMGSEEAQDLEEWSYDWAKKHGMDNYYALEDALASTLTMHSARTGDIDGDTGLFAEMIVQQLGTSTGLVLDPKALKLNPRSNISREETLDYIYGVSERVQQLAERFRKKASGKLIIVAVN